MVEYHDLDVAKLQIPVPRQYLEAFLKASNGVLSGKKVLDVGAGLSPYRSLLEDYGLSYTSQDFSLYDESQAERGFVTRGWNYPKHDYVCDVLEIPEQEKFDLLICTEVLEHVPDPVATFKKLKRLLAPKGQLFVSVPAMSFVHQAPYFFSSGLSTFWFEHWAKDLEIEVVRIISVGNYSDFMTQELHRVFYSSPRAWLSGKNLFEIMVNRRVYSGTRRFLSKRLSYLDREVLSSSPMNTIFVGQNG